jgi:hyperosmotically inducible protein
MMRKNLIALAAGACLAVSMPLAHAEKTAGERMDDSALTATTKAALVEADGVPGTSINVEVYMGMVQLGGFVETQAEKDAAIAAAQKVEGHTKVIDSMAVVPGGRSLGETTDDTTAQARLKADLAEKMGVEKAAAINTDVRRGEALLTGWIAKQEYKDEAGTIAKNIKGVTKVHNLLSVKP